MTTSMRCSISILATCALLLPVRCLAEDAVPVRDSRRFPADLRALHGLRDEFFQAPDNQSDTFLRHFWVHSGRVARERGSAILYAMFEDAPHWQDEEILVYYSLIFQLKRRPTLQIFAAYEHAHPASKPFFDGLRNEIAGYDEGMRAHQEKR